MRNEEIDKQIEVVITKDEFQHLAFLCKSEIDSMGRITAGILRILKLEGTVGQSAIDQLSTLGMQSNAIMFCQEQSFILLSSNKYSVSHTVRGFGILLSLG